MFTMPLSVIAALIIVFFAVVFSLQNAIPVTIRFFNWTFEGSLVIVLLTTLCTGMLIHMLASVPTRIKKMRQITQLHKRIAELERSLGQKISPPRG